MKDHMTAAPTARGCPNNVSDATTHTCDTKEANMFSRPFFGCRFGRTLGVALLAALLFGDVSAARASSQFRQDLENIATSISKLLKGRNMESIAIGQFSGPPNFPTSAGAAIVKVLTDEFQKQDIQVRSRAAIGLKGEYALTEVKKPDPANRRITRKFLAVKIRGTLVNQFGETLTDFTSETIAKGEFGTSIAGEEVILQLIGTPVDLPADAPPETRDRKIRESLVDPKVHIAGGTKVSTKQGSPYAVEILVDGKPQPIRLEEGLPFVTLRRGQSYAIRVVNSSPHDAAVRISIDGLSVFSFSEVLHQTGEKKGQPLYEYWIIPKNTTAVIPGWFRNHDVVDSFLITGYAKSALAELGKANEGAALGTITVSFAAAWPVGSPPPSDEPGKRRGGDQDLTGRGPSRDFKSKPVARDVGVIRASVSIRYSKPQ